MLCQREAFRCIQGLWLCVLRWSAKYLLLHVSSDANANDTNLRYEVLLQMEDAPEFHLHVCLHLSGDERLSSCVLCSSLQSAVCPNATLPMSLSGCCLLSLPHPKSIELRVRLSDWITSF